LEVGKYDQYFNTPTSIYLPIINPNLHITTSQQTHYQT